MFDRDLENTTLESGPSELSPESRRSFLGMLLGFGSDFVGCAAFRTSRSLHAVSIAKPDNRTQTVTCGELKRVLVRDRADNAHHSDWPSGRLA
jgi:hypothetical protein